MRLDVFDCFRWILATIATVYATVVTVQSAMGWYAWLRGNDKYVTLARRYLIVHGLRLRVRTFGGDVLVCGLLCATFLILWYAHGRVELLGAALNDLRHPPRPPTTWPAPRVPTQNAGWSTGASAANLTEPP